MIQIAYGRKRPYPRVSSNVLVLKLQDLGKIRYGNGTKIPEFLLLHQRGFFSCMKTEVFTDSLLDQPMERWSMFGQTANSENVCLAIHTYNKINSELHSLQEANDDLKQLTRLQYCGLKLFKSYFDQMLPTMPAIEMQNIYQFWANSIRFSLGLKKLFVTPLPNHIETSSNKMKELPSRCLVTQRSGI